MIEPADDQGVDGPGSALGMSDSPDLIDSKFVEENALGSALAWTKKFAASSIVWPLCVNRSCVAIIANPHDARCLRK